VEFIDPIEEKYSGYEIRRMRFAPTAIAEINMDRF